jgi:hypothetical protein
MATGKYNMKITNKLRQSLIPKKLGNCTVKQPFGGPEQVVEYLGRYSHKIAISNHRLKSIADGSIIFSYKDYKDGSKTKMMTLEADEFLRRFCMHILPPRFMKIRHYGFLSNRGKQKLKIHLMTQGKIPAATNKIELQTSM